MNLPILSVITPCHNQGEYLLDIIKCFPDCHKQNQYELIFINDGSTEILDENLAYSIVYSDLEYFGLKTGISKVGLFNLRRLMLWNFLHVSSVYRREIFEKVGGYDPKANGLED